MWTSLGLNQGPPDYEAHHTSYIWAYLSAC